MPSPERRQPTQSRVTIVTARFVAPMDRPIIRDGAVAFAGGVIIAVGDAREVTAARPGADIIDLGDAILLPGLVNAHTHLELTAARPSTDAPTSFVDWIIGLRDRIDLTPANVAASVTESVRLGIEQCIRFGVTTVGDISQQSHLTRPLLAQSPIRCVSYGEVLGLARRRGRFDELLPQALDTRHATDRLHIGLSPHAPYTVDLDGYRECLDTARQRNLPLATHLAETPDEQPFLVSHAGPFQQMWQRLGFWSEPVPTFHGSPVAFARAIGLLDYPTLLAHVNYCTDAELDMLSRGRASVVYCPRTHAHFDHPPHRWREMLERGINVAIGTDSAASSPDLNLIDDLRLLRNLAPEVPAQTLWEMATIRAARAIQMDGQVGSLTPGKAADVVAFDVSSDEPLEELLHHAAPAGAVWIAGNTVAS